MKRRKHLSTLCVFVLLIACSDSGSNPGSMDSFVGTYVGGSIGANLMPLTSPDPIGCFLDVQMQNADNFTFLRGMTVQGADVYAVQSKQRLGSITFTHDWDGELTPGETKTVRLLKRQSETMPFQPPCGQYVYLEILVAHPTDKTRRVTTDSLMFGCYY